MKQHWWWLAAIAVALWWLPRRGAAADGADPITGGDPHVQVRVAVIPPEIRQRAGSGGYL